jgi:hypothetical protein
LASAGFAAGVPCGPVGPVTLTMAHLNRRLVGDTTLKWVWSPNLVVFFAVAVLDVGEFLEVFIFDLKVFVTF